MRRRFSYAWLVAGACVVVIVLVALGTSNDAQTAPAGTDQFGSCPGRTPGACAGQLATALSVDEKILPLVSVPADLRYERGFVTKNSAPAAGYFVFLVPTGTAHPPEITLRVTLASARPYDVKHRGGKLGRLPSGRAYLDFTSAVRSGPFVEHLGRFELVVSFDAVASEATLRTPKLELLDSVTQPR